MVSDTNTDGLDPEIAELLGIDGEEEGQSSLETLDTAGRPITKTDFKPINLKKIFQNKNAYMKIIAEGGEMGQRLHELITKFSKAKDKDERSMYREKIGPAYWNLLLYMVNSYFDDLTSEKQALFRYGLLNSSFIDDNQKRVLEQINQPVDSLESISYVDEWLYQVGNGAIKPSAIDETKKMKKKSTSAVKSKMERKAGAREAEIASLKQKIEQHLMVERSLSSTVSVIVEHEKREEYGGIITPYSTEQKRALLQVQDIAKSLIKSDKEIESTCRSLKLLDQEITTLKTNVFYTIHSSSIVKRGG